METSDSLDALLTAGVVPAPVYMSSHPSHQAVGKLISRCYRRTLVGSTLSTRNSKTAKLIHNPAVVNIQE
jgi:hypothetical protein